MYPNDGDALRDDERHAFYPIAFDMRATIGMTKNVVTSAPTLPKSVGQTPTAEASSLNKVTLDDEESKTRDGIETIED